MPFDLSKVTMSEAIYLLNKNGYVPESIIDDRIDGYVSGRYVVILVHDNDGTHKYYRDIEYGLWYY